MSCIRISLVLMAALCCKESKTLSFKETAICCRNVKTFCLSNGPTFAVLVMLRIASASAFFPYSKNSVARDAERSKTRPGNYSRFDNNQSIMGNVASGQHANKITQRSCELYIYYVKTCSSEALVAIAQNVFWSLRPGNSNLWFCHHWIIPAACMRPSKLVIVLYVQCNDSLTLFS